MLPSLPDSLYGSLAPLRSALERATARAELRAHRCHAVFPLLAPLAPHEQCHQLRLPLLHAVLVLAIQNRAGSTAVAGRRRLRPPVRMAGPPRATSRPSVTTSGRARDPWCSPAPQPPTAWPPTAGAASSDGLPCSNPVRDLLLEFDEVQGPNCEVSDSCE